MEPILGTITLFAGNFEPKGWAFCNGQSLPIAQNSALYSLLGTQYGGDGVTTFQLPDLRGRVPVHAGAGDGLTPRRPGDAFGEERVALLQTQVPPPGRDLVAASVAAEGRAARHRAAQSTTAPVALPLHPLSIPAAGGGQPHDNMQPSLCMSFIIALEGIYPSRN